MTWPVNQKKRLIFKHVNVHMLISRRMMSQLIELVGVPGTKFSQIIVIIISSPVHATWPPNRLSASSAWPPVK